MGRLGNIEKETYMKRLWDGKTPVNHQGRGRAAVGEKRNK